MADIKIEVTLYEGYRGAERPSSFLFEGNMVHVIRIQQTWVEEEHKTRAQKRFFVVRGSDQYVYRLYCDLGSGEWFYQSRESDLN